MQPRPGASSGTRRGRRSPGRQRASAASASRPSSRGSARTRPSVRRTAPRRPARPASAPSAPSRSAACATEAGFCRPPPRDPAAGGRPGPLPSGLTPPPGPANPPASGGRVCRARQGPGRRHRAGPLGALNHPHPLRGANRARGRRGVGIAGGHPNPVRAPPLPHCPLEAPSPATHLPPPPSYSRRVPSSLAPASFAAA